MIRRILALLLLLPALTARATPVEPPLPDLPSTGCEFCAGKGWAPCPHPWESLKTSSEPVIPKGEELDIGPLKVGTFFCSACLEQVYCCRGLGWKPCDRCDSKEAKALWKERKEVREAFVKFRRDVVDRTLAVKAIHILTEHFEFVCTLKGIPNVRVWVNAKDRTYRDGFWFEEMKKIGINERKVKPESHFLAHLYARRLEECYEQFRERFDPDGSRPLDTELYSDTLEPYTPLRGERTKRNPKDKMDWARIKAGTPIREWIFLLNSESAGNTAVLGGPATSIDRRGNRAVGGADFFSFYGSMGSKSKEFGNDPLYHQYVYHNVAELLIHDYTISGEEYRRTHNQFSKGLRTPYFDLPDWVHEGWARVQEMDRFGEAKVWCINETQNPGFQPGKWEQYVDKLKKWCGAKKLVPFPEITRKNRDAFDERIHIQIWYILDYLRRRDPIAFPKLIARSKMIACELNDEKEGFTRALDETYGLTPLALEDAWRADVLKKR